MTTKIRIKHLFLLLSLLCCVHSKRKKATYSDPKQQRDSALWYIEWGYYHQFNGDTALALEYYVNASLVDPKFDKPFLFLAYLNSILGYNDAAIEAANRALFLNKTSDEVQYVLGVVCQTLTAEKLCRKNKLLATVSKKGTQCIYKHAARVHFVRQAYQQADYQRAFDLAASLVPEITLDQACVQAPIPVIPLYIQTLLGDAKAYFSFSAYVLGEQASKLGNEGDRNRYWLSAVQHDQSDFSFFANRDIGEKLWFSQTMTALAVYDLMARDEELDVFRDDLQSAYFRFFRQRIAEFPVVAASIPVFFATTMPFSPQELRTIAEAVVHQVTAQVPRSAPPPISLSGNKLRVGYATTEACGVYPLQHPVGRTLHTLLRLHAAGNAVEASVFCLLMRDDIQAVSHWMQPWAEAVDLSDLPDEAAAHEVNSRHIHVLVDLAGHVQSARPGIFARSPSAVQVSYLGFPGTTGASFTPHIAVDSISAPPEFSSHYSEKFIYVPHFVAYEDDPSLRHQRTWEALQESRRTRRREYGVEQPTVVFGNINRYFKFNRQTLELWSSIFSSVRDFKLLVIGHRQSASSRKTIKKLLANMTQSLEVDVIYTQMREPADYITDFSVADLMLESLVFHGVTTGMDASRSGVPSLSTPGEKLVQRVGSSNAIRLGISELVARNLDEYREIATILAMSTNHLRRLREKHSEAIARPGGLFDTQHWVDTWERRMRILCDTVVAQMASMHVCGGT